MVGSVGAPSLGPRTHEMVHKDKDVGPSAGEKTFA